MSEKKRPGDLIDRQSVRTTFRFSEEAIEALGWLSERYDVPMKDVLDFSLQDELAISLEIGAILSGPEALSKDNSGVGIEKCNDNTVRRTVVVTRKTLKNLRLLSDKYKLSRDALINNAILYAKKITEKSDEIDKDILQETLTDIKEIWDKAGDLDSKLSAHFGSEHPVVEAWGIAVVTMMNAYYDIEKELTKRTKE